MTLKEEIDEIETKLESVSQKLDELGERAKRTIDSDQTRIFKSLHAGVASIQTTISYLENCRHEHGAHVSVDYSAIGDDVQTADAKREIPAIVVRGRAGEMKTRFTKLREASVVGLEHVESINGECHELDIEVDRIRVELKTLISKVSLKISQEGESIEGKKEDQDEAEDSRAQCAKELRELEVKIEEAEKNCSIMLEVSVIDDKRNDKLTLVNRQGP